MNNKQTASEEQANQVITSMYVQYRILENRLDQLRQFRQYNNYSNHDTRTLHYLGLAVHHMKESLMDLIQKSFVYYAREEESLRDTVTLNQYYTMWEFIVNDPDRV